MRNIITLILCTTAITACSQPPKQPDLPAYIHGQRVRMSSPFFSRCKTIIEEFNRPNIYKVRHDCPDEQEYIYEWVYYAEIAEALEDK